MSSELPDGPTAIPARGRSAAIEAAFAALSSALIFALFLLLPLAGAAALFAGVPLVRLAHRRGLGPGLAGAALAAGLLAGLGFAAGGASETAAAGLLAGVSMGLPVLFAGFVRRGMNPSTAFLALCTAGFLLLAGALFLRQAQGGDPIRREIAAVFDAMTPPPSAAAKPGFDAEAAARLTALRLRLKEFAQIYWLGLVGASWVLAAAIGFYAGAWAGRPAASAELTRFESLRVPAPAVGLFVAAGAGFALLPNGLRPAAGDVLLPLLALYFLAGLSIICHFARRWFRARILRAGLYALVTYFPLCIGVGLLGLFDWYADFRHRGEKA